MRTIEEIRQAISQNEYDVRCFADAENKEDKQELKKAKARVLSWKRRLKELDKECLVCGFVWIKDKNDLECPNCAIKEGNYP